MANVLKMMMVEAIHSLRSAGLQDFAGKGFEEEGVTGLDFLYQGI